MGDGRRLGPSMFGRQVSGTCTCLRNPSFPFLFQPICPCLHLRELSILYLSQSLAGSWGSLTLSISCSFINKMSIARVVPASTLFDSVFPLLSVSGAQSEPASVDRQPHAHGDIGGHSPSGRQVRAPLSTSNIFYRVLKACVHSLHFNQRCIIPLHQTGTSSRCRIWSSRWRRCSASTSWSGRRSGPNCSPCCSLRRSCPIYPWPPSIPYQMPVSTHSQWLQVSEKFNHNLIILTV